MNSTNKNIDIHTLDKTIVYLNSDTVTFNTNNFDISFDLAEPIKNVVYIKIMKVDILIDVAPMSSTIKDGDPIFLNLRNYNNRILSKTKVSKEVIDGELVHIGGGDTIKCFEMIVLNFIEKIGYIPLSNTYYFKTEYTATGCNTTDTNVIVLNPIEAIIKRFDLQIYDKFNNIILKNCILKCSITLCIYHSKKNLNNF
jgi:hypothetical protein